MYKWTLGLVLISSIILSGCGYNTLQSTDEQIKASWGEVLNQYKVSTIQATPELINNPDAFSKFQHAQGELSSALSRLMVIVEKYPELKSDTNFRDLQAQLEGTENRITVARNRYIQAVKDYNVTVRSFPSNLTAMMFGYAVKPTFAVENEQEIVTPPKVDFSSKDALAK